MHDLVIRAGRVVDGTGSTPRTADVAIDGDRIVEVGRVAAKGRRELDADGLLVTPGWVDVHTHYDGQVSWDRLLSPSCWHGVTTVVMGNCGVGFAPVAADAHDYLISLMEGVEDIPGTALHEGITWAWESFPDYLDSIARERYAIDIGTQVPHGALRAYVMGERGADHEERATTAEIERMAKLTAEAIAAGALGFSTSRTINHRARDGRHTPSLTAAEEELVGIAAGIRQRGEGVIEAISDFFDVDTEWNILQRMVEVSGRPMSLTVLQNDARPDLWQDLLARISGAQARGLDMRGQVAARPVGLLMSFDGRAHPFVRSSTFQSLASKSSAERLAALRDPAIRARILSEDVMAPMTGWNKVFALNDPPDYEPELSESIAARAASMGVKPEELAYDTLLAGDGTGFIYVPVMNYTDADCEAVRTMLTHPYTVSGLGDAGAHVSLICDGSFATSLLVHWGRDRRRGERLPVEWIVKAQCADTARLVGLHDRGVLASGLRADVNLIDFERLHLHSPEMLHDLPAGGKRLVQRVDGYRTTIKNGEVTFEDSESTGVLNAGLIRGAQSAPA